MHTVVLSNRGRSAVVLYCFLWRSIMANSINSFIAGHIVEQGETRGMNPTDKHVAGAEEANAPAASADHSLVDLDGLSSWADMDSLTINTSALLNETSMQANNINVPKPNPLYARAQNSSSTLDIDNTTYSSITASNTSNLQRTTYDNGDTLTSWPMNKTASCKLDPRWRLNRWNVLTMLDYNNLLDNVLSVYVNARHTFGVITFDEIGAMHDFLMKHTTIQGKNVQWTPLNTPFTYVSLMSVPTEIPDHIVANYLEKKYGKVYGVRRKFDEYRSRSGNIYKYQTQTRTLKMTLTCHIPTQIKICGYPTKVIYTGQPGLQPVKCTKCGLAHSRSECTMRCNECGSMHHRTGSRSCPAREVELPNTPDIIAVQPEVEPPNPPPIDTIIDISVPNEDDFTWLDDFTWPEPPQPFVPPLPVEAPNNDQQPSTSKTEDTEMVVDAEPLSVEPGYSDDVDDEGFVKVGRKRKNKKKKKKTGNASDNSSGKPSKVQVCEKELDSNSSTVHSTYNYNEWIDLLCDPKVKSFELCDDINTFNAVRAKAMLLMCKGNIEEIMQFGYDEKLISDVKSIQGLELSSEELREQVGIWINQMSALYNQGPVSKS